MDRWTHIRVDKATKQRLEALRKRLEDAYVAGQTKLEIGRWEKMTVDQVINYLLDLKMGHDARKRKHAGRRAGGGKVGGASEATS